MRKISLILAAVLLLSPFAGCSAKNGETASVQSVSMICGLGSTGLSDRFAGIVTARSETEIRKDEQKMIKEILVSEGEDVSEGQVLFSYDMEQVQLSVEKGKLELEQLRYSVISKENEKATLEKEKEKASEANKLSYTLAIQEADTAIRETNYNITLKEKEVQKLEEALDNLEVTSPVNGRVQALNEEEGYDNYGNRLPFMMIVETGAYRVKGYINEQNAGMLIEGTPVLIRSRLDSSMTWTGTISMIDWENGTQNNNNYYYGEPEAAEMGGTTKYPFYVEMDTADGLLLGQHVYIESATGADDSADTIRMPAFYLFDVNGDTASVWAQNEKGLLEKRSVTVGIYDEMTDTYEIMGGLTAKDYIAFPEETLKPGMTCVQYDESAFSTGEEYFDGGYDTGFEGGYVEETVPDLAMPVMEVK